MYFLTQKRKVLEGSEYTVYGMRYNDELYAEDISPDKEKVRRLVSDCNKHSLSPIHMYEVIEDFIAE